MMVLLFFLLTLDIVLVWIGQRQWSIYLLLFILLFTVLIFLHHMNTQLTINL